VTEATTIAEFGKEKCIARSIVRDQCVLERSIEANYRRVPLVGRTLPYLAYFEAGYTVELVQIIQARLGALCFRITG
jgi:hypothetical protein